LRTPMLPLRTLQLPTLQTPTLMTAGSFRKYIILLGT